MTFDEMRRRAISEWEALEHSDKPRILIGAATCGRAAGALAVLEAIKSRLAQNDIEAIISQVGCIGPCYAEPLINIIKPGRPHIYYGNLTPELASQIIEDYLVKDNPRPDLALGTVGDESIDDIPEFFELPMLKPQVRVALRNCGLIDPENINHYIANGGYEGLVKALSMSPEAVIEEIKRTLGQTPPELAADIVERGIVMTGGGSLLKGLPKLISKETGVPVILAENALLCVAMGAGMYFDHSKKVMHAGRTIYDRIS